MVSYTQKSHLATMLATKLKASMESRGFTVWLDTTMQDKSEDAMQEAVENSMVVLAIITGDTEIQNDPNAYLNRPFCQAELRWAKKAKIHLQPVIHSDDKTKIGKFIEMAPDDLKHIGGIDFVDVPAVPLNPRFSSN